MRSGNGLSPAASLGAERVIAERPTLKADQAEMIRRLLTDPGRISVVIGEAGTGKTYAIVAAAEAWAREGVQLGAAAPTWRAANVMRADGLAAQSTASLLAELDRAGSGEGLERGSVLLVDEAGMVDSASLARLIDHADAAQARLILVGDYEQLSEIESGGLFRAIAEREDPITLDEVIRHRFDVEREGAKRIREGEGKLAPPWQPNRRLATGRTLTSGSFVARWVGPTIPSDEPTWPSSSSTCLLPDDEDGDRSTEVRDTFRIFGDPKPSKSRPQAMPEEGLEPPTRGL